MKLLSFADSLGAAAVDFADGRIGLLDALHQRRTYAGLLLGMPNARINDMVIDGVMALARKHFGDAPAPHLIEPPLLQYAVATETRKLSAEGFDPVPGERGMARGYCLPAVTCVGSFRCPDPLDPDEAGMFTASAATIIWFQDGFGFPPGSAILDAIRALDWREIAADVSD